MSAGVIYNNGSALTATAAGTSGYVLTSQGSGSPPIFAPGGGGGALTAFGAYLNPTVSNVTGDGTLYQIFFNNTFRNDGSIYDTATGLLTVNQTGVWNFTVNIAYQGILVTNIYGQFFFQTGGGSQWGYTLFNGYNVAESGNFYITGTALIPMTSGDTLAVYTGFGGNGTPNVNIAGSASPLTSFSGYFVGV